MITSTFHTFNPSPHLHVFLSHFYLLCAPAHASRRHVHDPPHALEILYTHLLVLSLRLQLGLCVVIFLHLALALLAGVSPVYPLSKPLSLLTSVSRSGLLPLQHIFCFIWPTLYFVRIWALCPLLLPPRYLFVIFNIRNAFIPDPISYYIHLRFGRSTTIITLTWTIFKIPYELSYLSFILVPLIYELLLLLWHTFILSLAHSRSLSLRLLAAILFAMSQRSLPPIVSTPLERNAYIFSPLLDI